MADVTNCDLCGATPAFRVEVGASIWNVARAGSPTGSTEAVDACEEHQEDAIRLLAEHVTHTLREQVPFHVEIEQRNDEIAAAQSRVAESGRVLMAHEAAHAHMSDPTPAPSEVTTPHEANLLEIAALEGKRLEHIQKATTLHNQRVSEFRASLKGKGAR